MNRTRREKIVDTCQFLLGKVQLELRKEDKTYDDIFIKCQFLLGKVQRDDLKPE